MNTQVDSSQSMISRPTISRDAGRDFQLPAGAGLALAVLIGSVSWMGIFALLM